MADRESGIKRLCDNNCGCTIPCSGGSTCRCSNNESKLDHSTCSCGQHCGCNPCLCANTIVPGTGCKCASACTCTSCHT
ncbi:putative plant EC metallothionein-like protein, family 15 [Lupinus albus]|uniref:Putative plant EC metallothionein-like protein, family 15 n=1 Tax=Lupinus albus TaxID=3870 RepID=A0A6A4QBI7_LUPAL|nr:putative plant EC metallothionein-like protein, family 15 [Lupinus albus]